MTPPLFSSKTSRLGGLVLLVSLAGVHVSLGVAGAWTESEVHLEDENRLATAWPSLTVETVLSGEFTSGVESFLADRFGERDRFMEAGVWLRHQMVLGEPSEEAASIAVDVELEGAEALEDLDEIFGDYAIDDGEEEVPDSNETEEAVEAPDVGAMLSDVSPPLPAEAEGVRDGFPSRPEVGSTVAIDGVEGLTSSRSYPMLAELRAPSPASLGVIEGTAVVVSTEEVEALLEKPMQLVVETENEEASPPPLEPALQEMEKEAVKPEKPPVSVASAEGVRAPDSREIRRDRVSTESTLRLIPVPTKPEGKAAPPVLKVAPPAVPTPKAVVVDPIPVPKKPEGKASPLVVKVAPPVVPTPKPVVVESVPVVAPPPVKKAPQQLAMVEPPLKARKAEKNVVIYNGRAMTRYLGKTSPRRSEYAESVNAWAREMPEHVRLYAILLPNAAGLYGPPSGRYKSPPQQPNLKSHFSKMSNRVIKVDGYQAMKPHAEEHLFFKTDHHWTARGAYYVYKKLVEKSGLRPPSLGSLNRVVVAERWRGTYWGLTGGARELREGDQVEVFQPRTAYVGRYWTKEEPDKARKKSWIHLNRKSYGAFIGTSYPRIQAETSVKNKRKVLVLMNSYGNPFMTLLLNSFETVIGIDYRYYRGNVRKLIESEGVTDVVFLNGIQSINGSYCARRLKRLLGPVKKK